MILFVKLIAAHLLGDFMFQTDRMCKRKYGGDKIVALATLALHSLVQALLSYLFVKDWEFWQLPLIIAVSHFLIDYVKIRSGKKGLVPFLIDQCAHYVVLACIWGNTYGIGCDYDTYESWLIFTSYVAVLAPSSILIKLFMEYEKWIPEGMSMRGLPNAGKWIGYIERVLILTFIYTGNIEGIGFLLASKSVFRFGELNRAKDLKVTEYVLIGTFASFAMAILIGFSVRWLLSD